MYGSNIFVEQDNPYPYLSEYEQECWLQQMTVCSSQRLAEAYAQRLGLSNAQMISAPSLEFEPLELNSSIFKAGNETQPSIENQPLFSYLPFELEQVQPITASNMTQNSNDEWRPVDELINEPNQNQTKKTKKDRIGISFNTTDYIIKHCFKKMLSQELRDEVQHFCMKQNLSYSSFCLYWNKKMEKHLPNKHIGLTKFKKMIDQNQSSAVTVCRLFLTLYLWRDYPRYVTVGGMRNKQEYLRCATKLMYISCLSKQGSDIIYQTRKH